jgi:hypothetical protein
MLAARLIDALRVSKVQATKLPCERQPPTNAVLEHSLDPGGQLRVEQELRPLVGGHLTCPATGPILQTFLTPLSGLEQARELVGAIERLSLARSIADIQEIVRTGARRLTPERFRRHVLCGGFEREVETRPAAHMGPRSR